MAEREVEGGRVDSERVEPKPAKDEAGRDWPMRGAVAGEAVREGVASGVLAGAC